MDQDMNEHSIRGRSSSEEKELTPAQSVCFSHFSGGKVWKHNWHVSIQRRKEQNRQAYAPLQRLFTEGRPTDNLIDNVHSENGKRKPSRTWSRSLRTLKHRHQAFWAKMRYLSENFKNTKPRTKFFALQARWTLVRLCKPLRPQPPRTAAPMTTELRSLLVRCSTTPPNFTTIFLPPMRIKHLATGLFSRQPQARSYLVPERHGISL